MCEVLYAVSHSWVNVIIGVSYLYYPIHDLSKSFEDGVFLKWKCRLKGLDQWSMSG